MSHFYSTESFFNPSPSCEVQANISPNQVAQDRVDLLNFIHKELFFSKVVRHIPAPLDNVVNDIEYFHQAEYKGRKIDIGVCFYQAENGVLTARAFAKFADAELSDNDFGTTIYADHAANATEAKKDKSSKVVAGLTKFYWAPRWNFVVRYLRLRMEGKSDLQLSFFPSSLPSFMPALSIPQRHLVTVTNSNFLQPTPVMVAMLSRSSTPLFQPQRP